MGGQSEALVPLLQELMGEAGLEFGDLDLIVTTVGPGAFTGLRIGLSTARALSLALGIPVAGVTTLEVMAQQYFERTAAEGWTVKDCAVVLETKRGDFYFQLFSADGKSLTDEMALSAQAATAYLEGRQVAIIGDAARRFINEAGAQKNMVLVDGFEMPDPGLMARLGLEAFKRGTVRPAEPLYLRGADVSERKTPLRVLASS